MRYWMIIAAFGTTALLVLVVVVVWFRPLSTVVPSIKEVSVPVSESPPHIQLEGCLVNSSPCPAFHAIKTTNGQAIRGLFVPKTGVFSAYEWPSISASSIPVWSLLKFVDPDFDVDSIANNGNSHP